MAFLSIVIPTRNRPQYLARVVELIASNTCESEVIVADNSDNDSLKDKLKKYTESGLVKYYYTSENLSVVDNFEKALEKVTGKYIIFLGDDDGIGPQIENIAHWMDDNHVDAAFSYSDKFLVNYYWPGVKSKF
ncbi:TPA: glycosyltransferase family 2 protein, partial [Escherichia coli]